MNVFIVLIPMLLMSAVFMEIRVIEMTLPSNAAASTPEPAQKPFDLAIRIGADAYVVEADGVVVQTIVRRPAVPGAAAPSKSTSEALTQVLLQIVADHPGNREVRIVANATTHYEEIVAVMDLARAAGLPLAALEGAAFEGA